MRSVATLVFPRERQTVPAARAVLEATLSTLGVADGDVADLAVALSEACSNAVRHASGAPCYQIEITLDPDKCQIVVSDHGTGFEPDDQRMPPPGAEGGRGLALMDALVDAVELVAEPGAGARITLAKHVDTDHDAAR